MATVLDRSDIEQKLSGLEGWSFENDAIHKSFKFGSFKEAMGFITRLAFEAEAMQHHPQLTNVYNQVSISLCTHDAGDKVTEKDIALANEIERISWV